MCFSLLFSYAVGSVFAEINELFNDVVNLAQEESYRCIVTKERTRLGIVSNHLRLIKRHPKSHRHV